MTNAGKANGGQAGIRALAGRLERLWEQGHRPDIHRILAEAGPLPVAQVAELLGIDQWRRWHAGERVLAEDYLKRYQPLESSPEQALELVYGEFLLREELNERPIPDEFLERFPRYATRLQEQFQLHRHLEGGTAQYVAHDTPGPETPTLPPRASPTPSAGPESAPTPLVAGYEILGELGRGGMGVVYKARQNGLGRLVALKFMRWGPDSSPQERARFRSEAEAVARLQHPHVVQIHEVGEQDGRPFFSLEFLEGGSLARKLDGTPRPARVAAGLVETLARAIHAAHRLNIVHRDLKPDNVLLAADGTPKIADFGLAKLLDSNQAQTGSDAVMGTPCYMAPEQAQGKARDVGPPADVYALGAILYELLTGRPPFRAESALDTLLQVISDEPVPPSRLNSKVPRDLETICLKCLAKEPARRYGSAEELAEELRRFQTGEPIWARRAGRFEHLVKWARRKPAAATLWAVSLAGLVLGLGTWLGLRQASVERQAETARKVSEAIQEATRLRGRAEAAPLGDLAPWKEALGAARRAEGLLAGNPGNEELRQQVDELLADLRAGERAARAKAEAADRDRQMLVRLHDARLLGTGVGQGGAYDATPAERAYAAAFRWYGVDVDRLSPEEAARRIRGRPIRAELAAALDAWGWKRCCLRGPPAGWERLFAVAAAVEPDPWRRRWREAMARQDRAALAALADAADVAALPALSLDLVGDVLVGQGLGPGRSFLRRAVQQHPESFWLNYLLGTCYHWGTQPPQPEEAIRYYTAARALNPRCDSLHQNLALALEARGALDEADRAFRETIRLNPDYINAYLCRALLLKKRGFLDKGIAVTRQAIDHKPTHAFSYKQLGHFLEGKGRLTEAWAAYRKAVTLKKDDPYSWYDLARMLVAMKRPDEAIAALESVLHLKQHFAEAYSLLGIALAQKKQWDRAIAAYRKALDLGQKGAWLYRHLGFVLSQKGQLSPAIAAYQQAIHLDKDDHEAYYNLGYVLGQKGQRDQAIAAYRHAIRLKPDHFFAHNNLGVNLDLQGRLDEAVAEYREAIRPNKDFALGYRNIGEVLVKVGRLDSAITVLKQAIRLDSHSAPAHYYLGEALRKKGRLEQAATAFREALRLKEDHARAHVGLGWVLQRQGQFAGGLAALRRGHQLGAKKPRWPYPSAEWITEAERLVRLDQKLPAILKGEVKLAAAADMRQYAMLCRVKKLYGDSVRLWTEALAADPKRADDVTAFYRYLAACSGALAAAGQDRNTGPLDNQERRHWRKQALDWLRANLVLWTDQLNRRTPQAHLHIRRELERWQRDPDLAGLREAAVVARLPADERAACRKLWAGVDALLQRARNLK